MSGSMAVKVKWKNLLRLFIVVFVITCFGMLFKFNQRGNAKVEINLVGNDHLKLSINKPYIDEGVKVKIDNKEVDLKNIEYNVKSNVDEKVKGNYEIDYEVIYNANTYKVKRYVEVLDDIAPTLTINQEYATQYKCKNKNKFNLDYIAEDNYDGIITDKVKVKVDKDRVILSVIDSSNNETKKKVPLKIIDDGGVDVIELVGKEIIYLPLGSTYEDEGAILKDGCGNATDATLEIQNAVDTSKAGEYSVNYQYTNSENAVIKKTRKVIVYDKKDSKYYEELDAKTVYLTFDDGPGQYTQELLDIFLIIDEIGRAHV